MDVDIALGRKIIRLPNFDYSQPNAYYVTICTNDKIPFFGRIMNTQMQLNEAGECARQCWLDIPNHYLSVNLDEFIIMPNHVHGIIRIIDVGAQNLVPLKNNVMNADSAPQIIGLNWAQDFVPLRYNKYQHIVPNSLSSIIRGYKIGVTKKCREHNIDGFAWQRIFYDHVVKNEEDLQRIRFYIKTNPEKWNRDRNNIF